jgi:hypothetical protein
MFMKKSLIVWPFISLLLFMLVSFGFSQPEKKHPVKVVAGKGIAVVELFTSEGCSSCPTADEAVTALVKDYPADVFVLGFHVDYWNYLGWKDAFSNADYSKRQEQYASAFALNSIYTPQVVVNGQYQFTGSDKSSLYSKVADALNMNRQASVELMAKASGKEIEVNYTSTGTEKSFVRFALVQLQASSAVQRGENRGRQLHHIDVVRDFTSTENKNGSAILHLTGDIAAKDCKVIAFVQQKNDLHITGAAACFIQ